jgi:FAD/FMN-containing dehydrogenase
VSITGIGGLTLGGGYGWLVRKHGLALDNLLSVDLVTAEGELITASPTQHPTLYWAVRGGGGNFGVVTSFEYQVHPVGSVLAGLVVHPRSDAMHLLRFYREQIDTLPDELTTAVLLFHLPAAPFLPPTMHGLPVAAMAICYAGDLETGEEVLRPLREFGTPLVDLVERVPYSVTQSMADGLWPPGLHYYWKSSFLRALPDDAMDTFVERASRAPSARTVVLLEHCTSNAIRAVGQQETAFPHRDWPMNLLIATGWERAEDTQENIDWTREFASAMQPHTENALYSNYNFLADAGDEGVRDAYGTSQPHLTEIKSTYDPTNLFRLNPNIRPV